LSDEVKGVVRKGSNEEVWGRGGGRAGFSTDDIETKASSHTVPPPL